MNSIAFLFTHGPHGNSSGREGLDVLLATSMLSVKIGIFFISDGILMLLPQQKPNQILSRNFINLFNLLALYNINKFYICIDSLIERGFDLNTNLLINAKYLSSIKFKKYIDLYKIILTF